MFDRQRFFSTCVSGILKQGASCEDGDGACVYRNQNGQKCVIGQAIPDDKYDPVMDDCIRIEGTDRDSLLQYGITLAPDQKPGTIADANPFVLRVLVDEFGGPLDSEDVRLISNLQKEHDKSSHVERHGYCVIAKDFRLNMPEIQEENKECADAKPAS